MPKQPDNQSAHAIKPAKVDTKKNVKLEREDKREIAREEHTNHFTNRAPKKD